MSAFIVSQETMHRVVDAVYARYGSSGDKFGGMPAVTPEDMQAIGQALLAMSARAVSQRYKVPAVEVGYRLRLIGSASDEARFKALACLIYQCSEGNVPTEPLYLALDALCDHYAHRVAMKAADRLGVPWDFPARAA